jgi:hypothetical protein
MTGISRLAQARIGMTLVLVVLVACTGAVEPTASPQPSPTKAAQTLPTPTPSPTAPPTPVLTAVPDLSPGAAATSSPSSGAASPTAAAGNPWQYLSDFPAEDAIEVSSVIGTPAGFVAVGYQPIPGDGYYGRRQGVVWRSADGMAWERLVPVEFELASLEHIALLNDQLYAFGWLSACDVVIDDPCADLAEAGWTVWSSNDGASWTRLPQSPALKTADLGGVVVGPDLLAAHGSTGDDSATPAVWLSADGQTWEETRELAGLEIDAMASGPHGFAAVGSRYVTDLDEIEALAARSADGRAFEPAQLPGSLPVAFRSMAATDAGYVAVGYADHEDQPLMASAIVSADGLAWSAAPAQEGFVDLGFHHVSVVPGGYLAIGFVPEADSFDRQLGSTWFSADGLSWVRAGDLQGAAYQQLSGAAVSGAGMVIFAGDIDEEGGEEVISTIHAWFSPIDGLGAQ